MANQLVLYTNGRYQTLSGSSNNDVPTWNSATQSWVPQAGGGGGGGWNGVVAQTYYVMVGGSDVTGDGSLAKPYATIQAALNTAAATYTGGEYVLISVGPGAFTGDVSITRKNILIQGVGSRPEDFSTKIVGSVTINPSSATNKVSDLVSITGCWIAPGGAATTPAVSITGTQLFIVTLTNCYLYTTNSSATANALACDNTNATRPRIVLSDCILATDAAGPVVMRLDRGDARATGTAIRHNSAVTLGAAGYGVTVANNATLWLNESQVETRTADAGIYATGSVADTKLILTNASVATAYSGGSHTSHGISVANTSVGALAALVYGTNFNVADTNAATYAIATASGTPLVMYGELSFIYGTNTAIQSTVTLLPLTEKHGAMNLPSLTASLPLQLDANKNVVAAAIGNAGLTNSSVTVTAGTGLSGGGSVALGASVTLSMPNVGTAASYGSATQVPVFTTDAQGRVTSVTNTPITGLPLANVAGPTGIGFGVTSATGVWAAAAIADTGKLVGFNGSTPSAITVGSGLTLTGDTLSASGGGGTVTSVTSTSALLSVANGTTTPALTVNAGTTSSTVAIGDDTRFNPAPSGAGKLAYDNGTGYVALAAGTATQVLHGGAAPSWSAVSLTADVTGTLPVANGGTGATTVANNLVFAGPATGGPLAPSFRQLSYSDISQNPYDFGGEFPGTPTTGEECFHYVACRAFTLPAGTSGRAYCVDAPTGGNTTFDVQKITPLGVTTTIGSIAYTSGDTVGTLTITSTVSIAAGDRIFVKADATDTRTIGTPFWQFFAYI